MPNLRPAPWQDPRPLPQFEELQNTPAFITYLDEAGRTIGVLSFHIGNVNDQSARTRDNFNSNYFYRTRANDPDLGVFATYMILGEQPTTGEHRDLTRRWNQEEEGAVIQLDAYGIQLQPVLGNIVNQIAMLQVYDATTRIEEFSAITGRGIQVLKATDIAYDINYGLGLFENGISTDLTHSPSKVWGALFALFELCELCADPRCMVPNEDEQHGRCYVNSENIEFHQSSLPMYTLPLEPGADPTRADRLTLVNNAVEICEACAYNPTGSSVFYFSPDDTDAITPCVVCHEVMVINGQHLRDELRNNTNVSRVMASYCWACWSNRFSWCEDCESMSRSEDSRASCNSYCASRSDTAMFSQVNNYSFTPTPIFFPAEHPTPERPLYIGMELETTFSGNYRDAVEQWLPDVRPQMIYAKSDASVRNGIELVTYPFAPVWARDHFPFDAFEDLIENWGAVNTDRSCGTHIHMSKASFSQAHLWKFLHLHSELPDFLGMLGGRGTDAGYGHFDDAIVEKSRRMEFIKNKGERFPGGMDRSRAVNLNPPNTIELRYPRGGSEPSEIAKNIELAQSLYDFTDYVNVGDAKDGAFKDSGYYLKWIQMGDYPNLAEWAQQRTPLPKDLKERSS